MSVKIYIAAHKDFPWCPDNKDYTIVCGDGELKNKYPVDVIKEHNTKLYTDLHDSYAELTRLRYIQMYVKPTTDYVGFCQYKRYFDFYDKTDCIENIMKHHDAILPAAVSQGPNVIEAYGRYHRKEDILHCIDIVKKNFPHMSKSADIAMKAKAIRANNMFIMKRKDFYDYCYFLFNIFDTYNRENGWKTMDDIKNSGCKQFKTHGFLAERLSNIFFTERFKTPVSKGIIIKR